MSHIISIGLCKTGTRTLMRCFSQLGLSSSDNTFNQDRLAKWCAGEPWLDPEDVQDEPVFAFWRQLADAYPDLRFVMTTRPFEDWFKSCSKNFFDPRDVRIVNGKAISIKRAGKLPRRLKLEALLEARNAKVSPALEWLLGIHGGGHDNSREFHEHVYQGHHHEVLDYFQGEYGKRLLVWDLTDDARWETLCEWLDVPVPEVDFPWENRTKEQQRWIEDAKLEDTAEAKLHMNPALFEKVRADSIKPGDVTALTNQIITFVEHDFQEALCLSPPIVDVVRLFSEDKKISLEPEKLVYIHRRSLKAPTCNGQCDGVTAGGLCTCEGEADESAGK